jgi:hypothetical protein
VIINSIEEFRMLSPVQKGYMVYMFGYRDDEPFVPKEYEPDDAERPGYERGQRMGVIEAMDSEE